MTGQTSEPFVEETRTELGETLHVDSQSKVLTPDKITSADRDAEQTAALRKLLGADTETKSSAPTTTDGDLDRAINALKRDNVPQSVIDSHAQNPALLTEWGLKAAKRQAETDSYGNKLNEMRSKVGTTAKSQTTKVEPSDEASDDKPVDLSELMGDEDSATAVRDYVKRERQQTEQAFRSELETQKFEVQVELAIARATRNVDLDATLVAEKMAEISNRSPNGSFPNVQALALEAVKQMTPAQPVRQGGQPSGKRSSPVTARAVTREEQQEQYLRAYLTQGKEQAERSINR